MENLSLLVDEHWYMYELFFFFFLMLIEITIDEQQQFQA